MSWWIQIKGNDNWLKMKPNRLIAGSVFGVHFFFFWCMLCVHCTCTLYYHWAKITIVMYESVSEWTSLCVRYTQLKDLFIYSVRFNQWRWLDLSFSDNNFWIECRKSFVLNCRIVIFLFENFQHHVRKNRQS